MDIEDRSLNNIAGIDRRSEAIRQGPGLGRRHTGRLQIDYTIPTDADGLEQNGINVLANAVAHRAQVDIVNIMTFDYYETHRRSGHGRDTKTAALNVHNQLSGVFPKDNARQLWRLEGMTLLPGIDDRGKIETTSLRAMAKVKSFALRWHLSWLSIWALQRDNGGCPGTTDSNTCSGIAQRPWAFSHLLEPFTS